MTHEHFPKHWATARIEEVTEFVTSGSRGWAKYYSERGPLFLRVGNLDHDTVAIDLSDTVHVQPPESSEGKRTSIEPGDILISITAEVGMIGYARDGLGEAYVNQHVALARPRPGVYSEGLAYSLLDPQGLQSVARKEQYGATKPGLSLIQVRSFEIPIPPKREQLRIVEAIESYFTRLDDAVATLERVERNLKRYRASVLKAAVEGRLVPTEAELAKQEGGRDYEPADVLLERILKERRHRWEQAELAKMEAKGKPPTNGKWKAKYKEPAAPDTSRLPDLPEGWCWATVDLLAEEVRYGSSSKTRTDPKDAVPVLRMGNIQDGYFDYTDLKYLPADHEEFPDLLLVAGDMLFNRTNSAELVGKSAVFSQQKPVSFASYLIRVRFLDGCSPRYVAHYINSPAGRQWIRSVVSQQVGQANVNGTKLKACAIPVPPAAEQERIVEEIERVFSIVFETAQQTALDLARCSRLRQCILKWAFEGKLADQNPNDEPASVLLERIRAKRETAAPAKKKTARRKGGGKKVIRA